jgi:hypothetical protein
MGDQADPTQAIPAWMALLESFEGNSDLRTLGPTMRDAPIPVYPRIEGRAMPNFL